jgi:hypothetical protein
MDINIINYILDKKKISQKKLAGMLKDGVDPSTLSRWRNGKEEIPKKRKIELRRIARIDKFKDGQSEEWLNIINRSEKIADDWYFKFASFLPNAEDSIWKKTYEEINYDSIWIDNIQRMLITLNDAGVPVKDLDFTFDPTRALIFAEDAKEDDWPIGEVHTPADKLLIPYIESYLALREWAKWFIADINDKKVGQLQFELIQKIPEIALYHLPKEKFKAVGTNLDVLDKYIKKSKFKAFEFMSRFTNKIEYFSLSGGIDTIYGIETDFDYFRYITEDKDTLTADYKALPKYIEQHGTQDSKKSNFDIFADETQQKILDGIQNNEKLLKDNNKLLKDHDKLLEEILEKLNNLTNNGE